MVFKSLLEWGFLTGQPLHHSHKAWRNKAWFKHVIKHSLTIETWTNLCMLWGPVVQPCLCWQLCCSCGRWSFLCWGAPTHPGVDMGGALNGGGSAPWRLKPHSAPKSLPHRFLHPENLLASFLELETCFSNSALWGTHGIWSLSFKWPVSLHRHSSSSFTKEVTKEEKVSAQSLLPTPNSSFC